MAMSESTLENSAVGTLIISVSPPSNLAAARSISQLFFLSETCCICRQPSAVISQDTLKTLSLSLSPEIKQTNKQTKNDIARVLSSIQNESISIQLESISKFNVELVFIIVNLVIKWQRCSAPPPSSSDRVNVAVDIIKSIGSIDDNI